MKRIKLNRLAPRRKRDPAIAVEKKLILGASAISRANHILLTNTRDVDYSKLEDFAEAELGVLIDYYIP